MSDYKRLTDEKFVKAVETCNMACVYGENCIECVYFDHNSCPETVQGRLKKAIPRLAELEDKIEQGELIELPIPYGTELHFLWSREHADKPQPPKVHSTKEWIFKVRSDGKMWLSSNDIPCGYYGEYLHELGKTVFLTREEAEKRLKELQE